MILDEHTRELELLQARQQQQRAQVRRRITRRLSQRLKMRRKQSVSAMRRREKSAVVSGRAKLRWLEAAKKIMAEQKAKLAPTLQRVATAARGVLERMDSRRGSTQRRQSARQQGQRQSRVESVGAEKVHAWEDDELGEQEEGGGGGGEVMQT